MQNTLKIKENRMKNLDDMINRIHELLNSPLLTPYSLISNVKLPNYNYVKYSKNDIGVVAEVECMIDNQEEQRFFYQFDEKDYLKEVFYFENEKKEILYDRDATLDEAKSEYYDAFSNEENDLSNDL